MTPSGSQVGVFGRDLAAGPGRADHVVRGARRSGRGQVAAGLGRIHAVVADSGYHRAGSYWTRPDRCWLAELGLPAAVLPVTRNYLPALPAGTGHPCRKVGNHSP
jgi:hypothetical protein